MRSHRLLPAVLLNAGLAVLLAAPSNAQDATTDPTSFEDGREWPRTFEDGGTRFTVYQPQIEKWDGERLLARSAVSAQTGDARPTFGALWLVGRTTVDRPHGLVTLSRFTIPRASFPSATDKADAWLAALRAHYPDTSRTLDLARLQASVSAAGTEPRADAARLKNDPPRMIFSAKASLLVLVDGKPVARNTGGTGLQRVINTRSLLLEDGSGSRFYLAVGERWLEASSLDGPWSLAAAAPAGADQAKREALAAGLVDLYAEDTEVAKLLAQGQAPAVFTSTEPAELIETKGEPQLAPVDGTDLLWVKNTDAEVFVDTRSNKHFVLASGRWFNAPSRSGPWSYVAGSALPSDFAKIPATHATASVLASVPGTPQAAEAVLANDVPETATVDRAQAHLETTFDGSARFEAVEGTNLTYASNSTTPIVRSGDFYYACENGVWFRGPTFDGPWTVADAVPASIYTIPSSCPIHYVTYVRIYDATPDYVCFGYTPGYFGTCLSWDGCVVWGTGWRHRPWIGRSWIGRPWSYGFAASYQAGWGYRWNRGRDRTAGYAWRAPSRPWWGPMRASRTFSPVVAASTYRTNAPFRANAYRNWQPDVLRRPAAASTFGTTSRLGAQRPQATQLRPQASVYTPSQPQTFHQPQAQTFRQPQSQTFQPQAQSFRQPQAQSFRQPQAQAQSFRQPQAQAQSFRQPQTQSFRQPQQTFRPAPASRPTFRPAPASSSHRGGPHHRS